MVGRLFDVLDPLGVLEGEVGVEAAQVGKRALRYAFQLGQLCAQTAQGDEVFHFHLNAVAYQAVFGKVRGQRFAGGAVASVQRTERGEGGEFHIFRSLFFSLIERQIYAPAAICAIFFMSHRRAKNAW